MMIIISSPNPTAENAVIFLYERMLSILVRTFAPQMPKQTGFCFERSSKGQVRTPALIFTVLCCCGLIARKFKIREERF